MVIDSKIDLSREALGYQQNEIAVSSSTIIAVYNTAELIVLVRSSVNYL